MKIALFTLLFLFSFSLSSNPVDYGHKVQSELCQCAKPFKSTNTWTKGPRSGFYCMATSAKGNAYKRYFSAWEKLKK